MDIQHTPSTASLQDFAFLHGEWQVTHRKLAQRLASSTEWLVFPGRLAVEPILDGRGNIDINWLDDPAGAYQAHSIRLIEPTLGAWRIWWIDWRQPDLVDPPVRGGFEGGVGSFYSHDRFEGRPIRVRTTYTPIDPDRAEWTQAFAPAGSEDWEINWIMEFTRSE